MAFKPDGYPQMSPYLMVTGGEAVAGFLEAAFGAVRLRRFDGSDGSIMHLELKIGDSVVMLSEGSSAYPAFPAWIHLYLPDVRSSYHRALSAGGMAVLEPVQKPGDPDLRAGVRDPSGNTWWISTQVG
jgi:uncharacterized glyoxalase superfamily protein PhnB